MSTLLSPERTAAKIIKCWKNSDVVVCTTAERIDEVSAVLIRPKLCRRTGVSEIETANLIARLHRSRVDQGTPIFLRERLLLILMTISFLLLLLLQATVIGSSPETTTYLNFATSVESPA